MNRISPSSLSTRELGDAAGKRHVRNRARGPPGQAAGAARYTNGLAAHKSDRPARPAFSLEAPDPETRRRYRPRRTSRSDASTPILMPVHHGHHDDGDDRAPAERGGSRADAL